MLWGSEGERVKQYNHACNSWKSDTIHFVHIKLTYGEILIIKNMFYIPINQCVLKLGSGKNFSYKKHIISVQHIC